MTDHYQRLCSHDLTALKKYYYYFFRPTSTNRLTFDEVIEKIRHHVFETQCRNKAGHGLFTKPQEYGDGQQLLYFRQITWQRLLSEMTFRSQLCPAPAGIRTALWLPVSQSQASTFITEMRRLKFHWKCKLANKQLWTTVHLRDATRPPVDNIWAVMTVIFYLFWSMLYCVWMSEMNKSSMILSAFENRLRAGLV